MRMLLVGRQPPDLPGYEYVTQMPYEGVVIGSLELGELLRFSHPRVLEALAAGQQVVLYTPGLPQAPKNRGLAASLASARRELRSWGVTFTDGSSRRLITAEMVRQGVRPGAGAVLTPLAREMLEREGFGKS